MPDRKMMTVVVSEDVHQQLVRWRDALQRELDRGGLVSGRATLSLVVAAGLIALSGGQLPAEFEAARKALEGGDE